ncbi:hypothetical protein SDC9_199023 [bioreactor metagenome]|uniref:Uncharacterized protein n=1 Tax=bioreactor metagenome TaxID=1076179 RepID=A0A645ILP0_9ZZZZ
MRSDVSQIEIDRCADPVALARPFRQRCDGCALSSGQSGDGVLDHGGVERGLGAEVMKDQGSGGVRCSGDVSNRYLRIGRFGVATACRLQNRLAPLRDVEPPTLVLLLAAHARHPSAIELESVSVLSSSQ